MITLRRRGRQVVIAIAVIASLVFFAISIRDAWDATDGAFPGARTIAASSFVWAGGLVVAAWGWAVLLGQSPRIVHGSGFLTAQLAKYVPGAVWQAAGQIGLARAGGASLGRAVTTLTVSSVTMALAVAPFAVLLALSWSEPWWLVRFTAAFAMVGALILLDRRWMLWVLQRVPRTREAGPSWVPDQGSIAISWLANVASLGAASAGYLFILDGFVGVEDPLLVMAGFAAAWVVGFVVVPIPAGVGLREVVLVAVLAGHSDASVVVAASAVHRLVGIATEGAVAAIASNWTRRLPDVRTSRGA